VQTGLKGGHGNADEPEPADAEHEVWTDDAGDGEAGDGEAGESGDAGDTGDTTSES
jgi:hypothetical protein